MEEIWGGLLGRNIQSIRLKCGLTQAKIAERLKDRGIEMSGRKLSNIETGRKNVSVRELMALQELFGVGYEEFFRE